ncbi:Flp family type IVb pilin [Vibrio cyclitrophicus]|nr:Flp family type IVb pilin [Vibrio cyclitrophicus]UPR53911.1 Flp family type IVb pilin [Vibrio cyclitrophicus]
MLTNLYFKVCTYLTTFNNDERGVTAIEYGLIAAAMAAVLVTAMYSGGLETSLEGIFDTISNTLVTAKSGLTPKT